MQQPSSPFYIFDTNFINTIPKKKNFKILQILQIKVKKFEKKNQENGKTQFREQNPEMGEVGCVCLRGVWGF